MQTPQRASRALRPTPANAEGGLSSVVVRHGLGGEAGLLEELLNGGARVVLLVEVAQEAGPSLDLDGAEEALGAGGEDALARVRGRGEDLGGGGGGGHVEIGAVWGGGGEGRGGV